MAQLVRLRLPPALLQVDKLGDTGPSVNVMAADNPDLFEAQRLRQAPGVCEVDVHHLAAAQTSKQFSGFHGPKL